MLERFGRARSGSVVCPNCGRLVGVNDKECLNCGRKNPGLWGFAPALRRWGIDAAFDKIVIGVCVLLYLASLAIDPGAIGFGSIFSMLSPGNFSLFLLGSSGAIPVFEFGRWWTVLSAGYLHGSLLHVLFNMMWLRQLGPAVAALYGTGRAMIIYTVASVCGFLLSSAAGHYLPFLPRFLHGAGFTVGASAAIFGLLGALVYYGKRAGSRGLGQQAWTWAAALFVSGFILPGVDNWAHLGGYLGGWVMARWLDPLHPERGDHHLLAIACLLATVAAVVASIITGLPFRSPG
ncbi:MAG: rhomboid family intramembrane serine protease [Acidobacteriota bacterium]